MGMPTGLAKCSTTGFTPAPNPNPSRWKIVHKEIFDNGYVLLVKYFDCVNFEGIKIMVYEGQYVHREYLDPHFDMSQNSPIARFRPDKIGWIRACDLARSL